MYYPCSKNKNTDQLCSYCEADLHLCFHIGKNPVFPWCSSIKCHVIRKPVFYICKTMMQINCTVTAQLICDFDFCFTQSIFFENPNFQAIIKPTFVSQFMLDLVKNPEDMLSCDTALITTESLWEQMSSLVGKPTMWFPNSSDTNQAAESQKQARSLKFWI